MRAGLSLTIYMKIQTQSVSIYFAVCLGFVPDWIGSCVTFPPSDFALLRPLFVFDLACLPSPYVCASVYLSFHVCVAAHRIDGAASQTAGLIDEWMGRDVSPRPSVCVCAVSLLCRVGVLVLR